MRILGLFLAAFAAILVFTGCESTGGYRVAFESDPGPPPPPPPPPPRAIGPAPERRLPPPPPPPVIIVEKEKHGPPPHAPAHGYRRMHHEGHDLLFDDGLGCYVVVGQRDYYFHDGAYFRFSGDDWQISAHIGGKEERWVRTEETHVPKGLRDKYKGKSHGKGHDKERDKGRGNGHGKDHKKDRDDDNDRSRMDESAPVLIKEARWGKY